MFDGRSNDGYRFFVCLHLFHGYFDKHGFQLEEEDISTMM